MEKVVKRVHNNKLGTILIQQRPTKRRENPPILAEKKYRQRAIIRRGRILAVMRVQREMLKREEIFGMIRRQRVTTRRRAQFLLQIATGSS